MESIKIPKNTSAHLKILFPQKRYRIEYANHEYYLYESNDPSSVLFLDKDGSVLGKPNFQINFFVFPKEEIDILVSNWHIEAIREWCQLFEGNVIKRELTASQLKLFRRLRRYSAHSFIQFILKKHTGLKVWDERGNKVLIEDYNNCVF